MTRILPLRHAEAATVLPALQPLVSKDGLLTAYPPTNSLIVTDTSPLFTLVHAGSLDVLLRPGLPVSEPRLPTPRGFSLSWATATKSPVSTEPPLPRASMRLAYAEQYHMHCNAVVNAR